MKPSNLRHRVTFLVPPNPAQDAVGGELPYVAGDTTWAGITFTAGLEKYAANSFAAQATHKFTMRFRAGVQTNWKLTFQGRTFNILYANNVGAQGVQLDLYCVEINGTT
jgi:SPP1 family predicted phage head-tail adaptor